MTLNVAKKGAWNNTPKKATTSNLKFSKSALLEESAQKVDLAQFAARPVECPLVLAV